MSGQAVSFRVGDEQLAQLRAGAESEGVSVSEFVRMTLASPRVDGVWICAVTDPLTYSAHATEYAALRKAARSSTGGRVFFLDYGASLHDEAARAFGR